MIGYIVGGAVAVAALASAYWYHETHAIKPGNLGNGTGMYGLDAGIPPELAQTVYAACQLNSNPAQLRDFAQKTRELGYPIAAHALDVRAAYVEKHYPKAA